MAVRPISSPYRRPVRRRPGAQFANFDFRFPPDYPPPDPSQEGNRSGASGDRRQRPFSRPSATRSPSDGEGGRVKAPAEPPEDRRTTNPLLWRFQSAPESPVDLGRTEFIPRRLGGSQRPTLKDDRRTSVAPLRGLCRTRPDCVLVAQRAVGPVPRPGVVLQPMVVLLPMRSLGQPLGRAGLGNPAYKVSPEQPVSYAVAAAGFLGGRAFQGFPGCLRPS